MERSLSQYAQIAQFSCAASKIDDNSVISLPFLFDSLLLVLIFLMHQNAFYTEITGMTRSLSRYVQIANVSCAARKTEANTVILLFCLNAFCSTRSNVFEGREWFRHGNSLNGAFPIAIRSNSSVFMRS